MSNLEKIAFDFANALVALVIACFRLTLEGAGEATVDSEAKPAKAEKPQKEKKFPASFSAWRKEWEASSDRAHGFAGEIFRTVSCVKWTPDQIDLLLCGSPDFEDQACSPEGVEMARSVLAESIGFDGALSLRGNDNPGPKPETTEPAVKRGRPKKAAEEKQAEKPAEKAPEVSKEMVMNACSELANRIAEGRGGVRAMLLKGFGSQKVGDIDASKYPAVLEMIRNFKETTTDDNDEF